MFIGHRRAEGNAMVETIFAHARLGVVGALIGAEHFHLEPSEGFMRDAVRLDPFTGQRN